MLKDCITYFLPDGQVLNFWGPGLSVVSYTIIDRLRRGYTMCRILDPMLEANVLGQYGANVGANVGGVGCQLHDASNSPTLQANIRQ